MLLRDADERYVIDVLVYHIELRYAGETAESVSLVIEHLDYARLKKKKVLHLLLNLKPIDWWVNEASVEV